MRSDLLDGIVVGLILVGLVLVVINLGKAVFVEPKNTVFECVVKSPGLVSCEVK